MSTNDIGYNNRTCSRNQMDCFFLSQKNGDILTIKKNKKNYQFVFIFALPLQCHDAFDGGEKEEEEVGGHGDGL